MVGITSFMIEWFVDGADHEVSTSAKTDLSQIVPCLTLGQILWHHRLTCVYLGEQWRLLVTSFPSEASEMQ